MGQHFLSKIAVSLDDFCDDYKNNAMNYLWWLKSKYPTFRVTLFSIPARISLSGGYLVGQNSNWMQLAVHGWNHDHEEVAAWDEARCNQVLDDAEKMGIFVKGFKAPNWAMTDVMRKVLLDRGYWLAEHHDNHDHVANNFPKLRLYCLCNPLCMHGHTWDLPNKELEFRNGIRQWIEERGLPFNEDTEFLFVDELFNPPSVTSWMTK